VRGPGPAEGELAAATETERLVALLRLPVIALLAAGQQLQHPNPAERPFAVALVLFAAWSCALLALVYARPASRRLALAATAVDVLAITALASLSGGPVSQARLAYFLVPVAAAFRFRPSVTAAAAVTTTAAYLGQGLAHPASEDAVDFVLVQAGYLLWVGAAAFLLSAVLGRRTRSMLELAHGRELLMAEAISAEERERRRLAEALHDHPIQNLLSARHELEEAETATGHPAIARAQRVLMETVGELREAIFDLHPYVLEQAGLQAALATMGQHAARRGRFRLRLETEPVSAGANDRLLLAAARELLANAAEHAGASEVVLGLGTRDGRVSLTVSDDGRGFDPGVLARRAAEGHIGLVSQRARVESAGGSLGLASTPGGGTEVEVLVPRA
jgi:two-component system NarL family sensor kinase